jgi:membrane-associated phospholipid phosphatase
MNFLPFDKDFLEKIADIVNPLLVVWFLVAFLWRVRTDRSFRGFGFFMRAFMALLVSFGLGRVNGELEIWRGLPLDPGNYEFPSGHMCFAVSLGVSLVLLYRRFVFLVVPLLALYGALIVFLGYHGWLDVIGAWVLMAPLAWIIHRESRRKLQQPNES